MYAERHVAQAITCSCVVLEPHHMNMGNTVLCVAAFIYFCLFVGEIRTSNTSLRF